MLPRQFRLKNTKAFNATYKKHHILSDENIIIYVGKEKKEPSLPTKFGFVVSKKYHKRAVRRNRIKRLLRETVRLAIRDNGLGRLNNYMSFIVSPKVNEKIYKANLTQIQKSFFSLLERI